jgi:hypothetical protein
MPSAECGVWSARCDLLRLPLSSREGVGGSGPAKYECSTNAATVIDTRPAFAQSMIPDLAYYFHSDF